MKEFAVTVKLHNNLLRSRRVALGLSAPQLAEKAEVSYGHYVELENLRQKPFNSKGWRPIARKLADFYRVLPEDLFPAEICGVQKSQVMLEMSAGDMHALTEGMTGGYTQLSGESPETLLNLRESFEGRLPEALKQLRPKEIQALNLRYGLEDGVERTWEEAGLAMGVCKERVRQLCVSGERSMGRLLTDTEVKYLYSFCRWCGDPEHAHVDYERRCVTNVDAYGYRASTKNMRNRFCFIPLTLCAFCSFRPATGMHQSFAACAKCVPGAEEIR